MWVGFIKQVCEVGGPAVTSCEDSLSLSRRYLAAIFRHAVNKVVNYGNKQNPAVCVSVCVEGECMQSGFNTLCSNKVTDTHTHTTLTVH